MQMPWSWFVSMEILAQPCIRGKTRMQRLPPQSLPFARSSSVFFRTLKADATVDTGVP